MPNFFLVGAFKSGTTSLYRYLGQHPDVYLSPKKEPGLFVPELGVERMSPEWRAGIEADAEAFTRFLERPHVGAPQPRGRVTTWEDYLKLFRQAKPGQAIGEGSVGYLWSGTAARAIRERIPDARILMILRNPCERAFSQYKSMPAVAGKPSFGEAIRRSAEGPPPGHFDWLAPFLEFGSYAEQVERYLRQFARERVRVYLYDDFSRDPERIVRDAFDFLDVRTDMRLDLSSRHNESRVARFPRLEAALRPLARPLARPLRAIVPAAARRVAEGALRRPASSLRMTQDDRRFLIDYYEEDVRRLESLLGRDLSMWLE